jgi:hypothetical protein
MKIFVFETGKYWEYCGGGLAIIAKDLNQARELFKELFLDKPSNTTGDAPLLEKEFENEENCKKVTKYCYYWILKGQFNLPHTTKEEPRVIMYSINYA